MLFLSGYDGFVMIQKSGAHRTERGDALGSHRLHRVN
jgi:hypothetical protein